MHLLQFIKIFSKFIIQCNLLFPIQNVFFIFNVCSALDAFDRYANLALIKTIRLLLSFLSGNSANLFCLRFTLQNHLFRNILNLSNYPQGSHFITCDLLWKNKRIYDVYSNPEDYNSFLATSEYNRSKDYQDLSRFAQTTGSLELS